MRLFRISAVLLLTATVGAAQAQTIARDNAQTDTQATSQTGQSQAPQSDTDNRHADAKMQTGKRDASMSSDQSMPAEKPQMPDTAPTGSVAREQFTSEVSNREPTDSLDSISVDQGKVYFFTDLRDFAGQTVTHRWTHDGKDVADVDFHVGGPRWRVWSSKDLNDSMTGQWTVQVLSETGQVIDSKSIQVTAAAPATSTDESGDSSMDESSQDEMGTTPSEPANMETPKNQNATDTSKDDMEPVTPPSDDKNGG